MSLKKGSEFESSHANVIAAIALEVREVEGSREERERERERERSVRSHDNDDDDGDGDEKRKKKMELLEVLAFVGGGIWEDASYVD